MTDFIFATGIENSYPVIAGGVRVDEMEKCGHYRRWREDLALARQAGLSHLRWGPAIYRTFLGPGRYDWSWADEVLAEMRRLGITPVLDLCHFGLPDWLGNFQNRDFPAYFAEYAGAFAARYPDTPLWTPVNEVFITALFSARYGWWNERLASDEAFVRATLNCCRAVRLAMHAVRRHVPDALFVQSESCEYTHASGPEARAEADFQNERRFLPSDLIFGRPLTPSMLTYARRHCMEEAEYQFFLDTAHVDRLVLGTDYYATNEHILHADGHSGPSPRLVGYRSLAREYYRRYRVPLMHTETNLREEQGSVRWLGRQWEDVCRLRQEGVPILGFTWYSLTDQKDWDTALREDAHRISPVGLYDLDRNLRPVGRAYADLVRVQTEAVRRAA